MKNILLALMLVSSVAFGDLYTEIHGDGIYTVAEQEHSRTRLKTLKREIERGGLVRLAERSEQAIDAIIRVARTNLMRRGHVRLAGDIDGEWLGHKGTLLNL